MSDGAVAAGWADCSTRNAQLHFGQLSASCRRIDPTGRNPFLFRTSLHSVAPRNRLCLIPSLSRNLSTGRKTKHQHYPTRVATQRASRGPIPWAPGHQTREDVKGAPKEGSKRGSPVKGAKGASQKREQMGQQGTPKDMEAGRDSCGYRLMAIEKNMEISSQQDDGRR